MTRIPVNPELQTWARERAGLDTLIPAGWLESGVTIPREGVHE